MKRIKKGDKVIVISGKYRGEISQIRHVIGDKVVVENVNIVSKHTKNPSGDSGNIFKKEMPIHQSNVALYNRATNKPDRIKFLIIAGKKHRYFKSSNTQVVN